MTEEENRPPVSRGETAVLKALWEIERGSVGEIFSAVEKQTNMDYSTVQTYVRRLEAKGYVTAHRIGRNKLYRPAIRKTQVIREAIDDFLDRMFDGQFMPMFKHLVDSRDVSSEELDDLMRIVNKLRADQEGRDDS